MYLHSVRRGCLRHLLPDQLLICIRRDNTNVRRLVRLTYTLLFNLWNTHVILIISTFAGMNATAVLHYC